MKNTIIIIALVLCNTMLLQSQSLFLKFDNTDNIKKEINSHNPIIAFVYKNNDSYCGDVNFLHFPNHKDYDEKRELTSSEYQTLLSQAKSFREEYIKKYKYCSDILTELNKHRVYILLKEGDKFYEYEVKYRFTRSKK